jgi:hypothetical protein
VGSWLGTCGVTRTPIYGGDPVAGFLLVEVPKNDRHPRATGMLNSFDCWAPLTPHFFGRYNDYGLIKNLEVPSWLKGVVESELRARVLPMSETPRIKALNPASLKFEIAAPSDPDYDQNSLFHQIQENRVFIGTSNRASPEQGQMQLQVGFMMVHRHVFDFLASQNYADLGDDPRSTKERLVADFEVTLQDVLAEVNDLLASYSGDSSIDEDARKMIDRFAGINLMTRISDSELFPKFGRFRTMTPYVVTLQSAFAAHDHGRVDEIINHFAEFAAFDIGMQAMRCIWSPQSIAASNYAPLHIYRGLNELVKNWISEREGQPEERNARNGVA